MDFSISSFSCTNEVAVNVSCLGCGSKRMSQPDAKRRSPQANSCRPRAQSYAA